MSTKKFLGLLIISLCLMIVVGMPIVSGAELITNPGMETGNTSGWTVNGAGAIAVSTAQKHAGTYSLLHTGRTATWNGPQQNITSKVQSGKTYACSGWVRLDNTASASIIMTIRKVDGNGTTYTNIATGTGSNSSWVKLSGNYTLSVSGTLTDLTIYFEGPGSGINYYLDDVSVSDGVTSTPTPTPPPTGSYVRFRNIATSLYIDGMGSTSNGANCCQYSSSTSNNQQWTLEAAGSNYKIKNRATGLYLDGMGRTSNGSICGQWSSSSSTNQQWIRETVGSNFKYKNAATGLYLDGMGSTANGANLCQWSSSSSTNQQWQTGTQTSTPTPTGSTLVKVMPLGDSITDGITVVGAYRIKLWSNIRNAGKNVDFVGSLSNGPAELGDKNHEGHSGWRIDQIDGSINGWMDTYKPKIVIMHIGTNDVLQNYNLSTAPSRLSALIDKICAKLPAGGKLYVAKIIPISNSGQNQNAINFNNQIPGIVQSKVNSGKPVYMVDMYSALTTADLADGVHPNQAGYDKMGNVWFNAINNDL